MAIKIRKKAEEEKVIQADNPEVLPPEGKIEDVAEEVKIPGLDDRFLATSGSALQWIMEHRRMVIFASCVVIAGAFAWLGVGYAREASMTSKSEVLTKSFITYSALTDNEAQELEAARKQYLARQGIAADTADVLKSSYTVPDDKTRFAAIERNLSQELPNYGGDLIATTGQLMLAGAQARLNHAEDAKKSYISAAKSNLKDVKVFAEFGQIELLLNDKNYADAVALLDDIMKQYPGLSAYATLEKGRIYEMAGNPDKAIAAYAQVSREFGQETDKATAAARLKYLTKDWESYVTPAVAPQNNVPQAAL